MNEKIETNNTHACRGPDAVRLREKRRAPDVHSDHLDAPEADDGTSLDFSQSSEQVQLERSGFVRAVNDVSGTIAIYEYLVSEQNEPIEYMSDIATIFRSTDTLMTVGANTAVGTQYAEGESEFFNVPILIPFIDGDLFSSETAGNAMNLSPSSEAYANYFSEHLYPDGFNRNLESYLFADSVVPRRGSFQDCG